MSSIVGKIEKISLPRPLKKMRYEVGKKYYWQKYKSAYEQSEERLRALKDKHKGERCFLVATGPSLNKTDFSLIKNEIIFGVNTLYKGLSRFDIKPAYYVVGDPIIFNAHAMKLLQLKTTLFLSGYAGRRFLENDALKSNNDNVILLHPLFEQDGVFSKDIGKGVFYGGSVVFLALQIIYYLGFDEVYLLGCDCDYSGMHRFDGSTTENLVGMAIGETEKVFSSYELYKEVFERNGRKIYNATVGGKLEVFERKKLEEII